MSRKPDFFIVGTSKSGTTSLYHYLIQHPCIFMPKLKEPHFFGGWRSPAEAYSLEEYLKLFEGVPEDIQAGEASTSYLFLESAAREIKKFRPDAKIIMVLRNPIDRAYSQYWNHVRDGVENLSFEEALRAEPERARQGCRLYSGLPPSYYIETGRYADQVARYLQLFGRALVRIYLFEDLLRDAEYVYRSTFSFLGVDPACPIVVGRAYNSSGPPKSIMLSKLLHQRMLAKEALKSSFPPSWISRTRNIKEWIVEKNTKPIPKMKPDTREALKELFREDILKLEEMIGRDLQHWLR